MDAEFGDLSVTIVLSYREANDLVVFILAHGSPEDLPTADAIKFAIREAVKERRDQERRAPRY